MSRNSFNPLVVYKSLNYCYLLINKKKLNIKINEITKKLHFLY